MLLTVLLVMLILPFFIFILSVDAGECESINYNQVLVGTLDNAQYGRQDSQ